MSKEQRIHVRKGCLIPVRYVYQGRKETFYARMINYGDGGLCLKTRIPIDQGAQLDLALEGYTPQSSSLGAFERYPVAVCWSKEVSERGLPIYETGVKYIG